MIIRHFIIIMLIGFLFMAVYSQEVKVYESYEEFAPLLENKNDTTYVVNFWATWCKPCIEEMPHFLEANKQFKDQKFKMILVSLDFKTQLESKVKPFITENKIEPEVVLLADSKQHNWIDKVNPRWTGSIPITIIFNKDFYFFKEGSLDFEELNEIITKNIKP